MRWSLAKVNGADFSMPALFDEVFRITPSYLNNGSLSPRIDVHEDEKALYVRAEIPGMNEHDLNVTLKENVLTISGEKKEEKTEGSKEKNQWFCERVFGSFSREIALPENVNGEAVKASYRNGVLEIELPKLESAQPKKINISVN
jgi:HSP20 family protein